MYDIDLSKGIRRRKRRGDRLSALLLFVAGGLFVGEIFVHREASRRWEEISVEWERDLLRIAQREEELRPSLEQRLELTRERAGRVAWEASLGRLARHLPARHALESVAYDGDREVLLLELRGWGDEEPLRFAEAIRADTLLSRFFPNMEDPVPTGPGRYRLVCRRREGN